MDFFTQDFRPDEPTEEEPAIPPWAGPPRDVIGAIAPIEKVLFRDETLVIALTHAVALPEGLKLYARMAARRVDGVNDDTWWDRRDAMFGGHRRHMRPTGQTIADEVLRFGVRFPDGSKATTVEGRERHREWPPPRPEGPVLMDHGGRGGDGGDRYISSEHGLWLWPLPPPEPFEFVVEWPAFGVPLTFTSIDGAALVAAARRAQPYWP